MVMVMVMVMVIVMMSSLLGFSSVACVGWGCDEMRWVGWTMEDLS